MAAARCLPNLTGLSLAPPVPVAPTAAVNDGIIDALLKKYPLDTLLRMIRAAEKNEEPAKAAKWWLTFKQAWEKLTAEQRTELKTRANAMLEAKQLAGAQKKEAKKAAGAPEVIGPGDPRLALVQNPNATLKNGKISDITVIKIFEQDELQRWHHEMKHAVNTMAEFRRPPTGTLADSDQVLSAKGQDRYGEFTCSAPAPTLADGPQTLCGGGFAALNNPGSFHNEFVRRLRRMVEEKAAIDHDVFGLDPAKPSEHTGWLLEQVVDRMLVRKPSQKVSAESWHRDIARGTHPDDKVYGGWLNLDLDKDQFFSCVPYTAYDGQSLDSDGFARLTPEQVTALEATPCTAEHPLQGRKRIKIPPGHLIVFNERTVHEVAPAPAPTKPMLRVFFGWRLSDPKYYFNPFTKKEFLEPGSGYEQTAQPPETMPGDRTRRMPMVPDVLHRLRRQEGMPLKSGQHPDQSQPMLYPERVNGDLPDQKEGDQPKLKHMDPRFKGESPGYGPPELALEYKAQFRKKSGSHYYPQGPPNWPGAYLVTAEPKDFIIPLSRDLYALWVPRIHHKFGDPGSAMGKKYPDGFAIVPQFFYGLKHYHEEWSKKQEEYKAVHHTPNPLWPEPVVYPDYEYPEMQLHLPMTRDEVMLHLGKTDPDPSTTFHHAPPFYDPDALSGPGLHLQRSAAELDAATRAAFLAAGMIQTAA